MNALIVVDMQNDFINGSLAVPDAMRAVHEVKDKIKYKDYDYIIFTRDSHPKHHISFSSYWGQEPFTVLNRFEGDRVNGKIEAHGTWPDHCVVNTEGWKFHNELIGLGRLAHLVVDKATEEDKDAYSGFQDTGLDFWLRSQHVDTVYIVGLAYDYCVKATALDAAKLAYKTTVFEKATAPVDPSSVKDVRKQLEVAGITVIT